MPGITPLRMGHCRVALIGTNRGFILVDAGFPGRFRVLTDELKRQGIGPREVLLVVVTHVHYDHVGCLAEVRELTGAGVLVHAFEAKLLEAGEQAPVRGTGPFAGLVGRLAGGFSGRAFYRAVRPTILAEDDLDLAPYGLTGRVIHTPGHTAGSLSVVIESGEAFVGDACFNIPIFRRRSVLPPFAADVPALLRSWERLLGTGASMFYPAHGRPFPREVLVETLETVRRGKGTWQ